MHTQGIIPAKENASKKISDRYQKKTYTKGATCIYGDTLYRAKADITTAEEWTAAHWEETNMETIRAEMAAEVSSLNANLQVVKSEIVTISFLNSLVTCYKVGRIVYISYGGDAKTGVSYGDLGTVGILPEGFEPISECITANLPISEVKIQLRIDSNGNITAFNYGEGITMVKPCRYSFVYISKY